MTGGSRQPWSIVVGSNPHLAMKQMELMDQETAEKDTELMKAEWGIVPPKK